VSPRARQRLTHSIRASPHDSQGERPMRLRNKADQLWEENRGTKRHVLYSLPSPPTRQIYGDLNPSSENHRETPSEGTAKGARRVPRRGRALKSEQKSTARNGKGLKGVGTPGKPRNRRPSTFQRDKLSPFLGEESTRKIETGGKGG